MLDNLNISREQCGPILKVMLPDPSAGGLSRRGLSNLATCLEGVNEDESVSVVILVGGRKSFCLGLDLNEFLEDQLLDDLAAVLTRCFKAFSHLQKPLIVVVEGAAIGFGASLMCHADVVVATREASFEAPFVSLGLLPEAASTLLLPQRIGYLRAMRFFCLGEKIDAQEAFAAGLVTEIVAGDARDRANELAKRLAKLPSDAIRTTRKLLRGDPEAIDKRIVLEVAACRQRLGDARLRRRVALFASAARGAGRRSWECQEGKHIA